MDEGQTLVAGSTNLTELCFGDMTMLLFALSLF
jgi:hypothetical protein